MRCSIGGTDVETNSEFDGILKEIPDPEYDELTAVEQQIVEMVSRGERPSNITRRLDIPRATLERHLGVIYKKLGTWTKAQGPSKPFPQRPRSS
jgi:DNA-binding NarL/FixJ family response regulator